ncbi:hypothetical protein BDM02DRAFT_1689338 [Thelephora ganbajun]|uniref:Uncharacterized protein n=1 Tax=Thelephora ganbajun TaxID=370292 RepID=A0ACB6ZL02_THEGA|nr:hypothetical protein BDM02DRAFT_1689338 [Thelephora ganbajun]
MVPPHFLLDALNDSLTSGTFVDTKFYAFSCRQASRRVGSPRALYCNSRILHTVPYLSTLFSNAFSERETGDINGGFPSDSHPYTEDYDHLSDSDLEDASSCFEENEEEPREDSNDNSPRLEDALDPQTSQTTTSDNPPPHPSSAETSEAQTNHRVNDNLIRAGKVAIIRDVAAVTFEAMLYFLYTGDIKFAPLSSDPRHELPAQARAGDWSAGKLPLPSAKSIYRLADKYDIPTLKEQAKAHIYNNLESCNITEEIFSSFSCSFPELLSMQVSQLVKKMEEESKEGIESATRKQLRNKIASLSQPQVKRAKNALAMIWNCVKRPLEPPATVYKFTFSVTPTLFPNWQRVKLALLKSISTGIFIDIQFYAYNKMGNDLPLDPKPLFTSSIVIEEWGPAITTQAVGIYFQDVCLADGPIDDYESWSGELVEESQKHKSPLKYQTEAAAAESREVVLLMSGAWKT